MKTKKVYQHISPVAVRRFRDKGHTLQEIGDYYNVSKQRIFQILGAIRNNGSVDWDIEAWRRKRRDRNKIKENG